MQKATKSISANYDPDAVARGYVERRPRGIAGATITSWREPKESNQALIFSKPSQGATVFGADFFSCDCLDPSTIVLSDGTEITFVLNYQFGSPA